MELPGRRVWEAMTNADAELAVRVEEPTVKILGTGVDCGGSTDEGVGVTGLGVELAGVGVETPDVARSVGEGNGAGMLELCCVFTAGSTFEGFAGGSVLVIDVEAGNGSMVLVAVLGVGDDPACALVVMSGSAAGSLAAVVGKGESPFPEVKV